MPSGLTQGPRADNGLSYRGSGLARGPNRKAKLLAAAWSNTWPAPQSTLDLDFANNRGWVRGVGQGGVMDAITFTRASGGAYVDATGKMQVPYYPGALGKNLLPWPQDFDNSAWVKPNATVSPNVDTAPDGTLTADLVAVSAGGYVRQDIAIVTSVGSVWVKRAPAGSAAAIRIATNNTVAWATGYGAKLTLTDQWQRISANGSLTSGTTTRFLIGAVKDTDGQTDPDCVGNVLIWGAQLEAGSTPTTYYPTNYNTWRQDWASTARTGSGTQASPYVQPLAANPTSNGILIEESRTNLILWCRDATQTNWTKPTCIVAKDQTGIDGVANAASSLTASSANATCIQSITRASGSATGSVYLKRITGTGTVQVTLDGSTWSTVDLSNGLWNRIVLSGTVTNPCVGVLIATSGDAVAMDFGQVEAATFATSPILTTTQTATRSADVATMQNATFFPWHNNGDGTFVADATQNATNSTVALCFSTHIAGSSSSNSNTLYYFNNSARSIQGTYTNSDGSLSGEITGNTPLVVQGASKKAAFSFSGTRIAQCSDGAVTQTAFVSRFQVPNAFTIGSLRTGQTFFMNGTIRRITFFPSSKAIASLPLLTGPST